MAANLPALDKPDPAFADGAHDGGAARRRRKSAAALAFVALAALAVTLLGAPVAIRAPFGLALVLLVPGHALARLGAPHVRALSSTSLAVALGLSLSVTAIAALGLDAAGIRVTGGHLAIALAAVTVAAAVGLALRRESAGSVPAARRPRRVVAVAPVLLLTAAAAVVAVSVALSRAGAAADARADRFTELWAVPPPATTAAGVVQLGVRNHEGGTRTFRLVVEGGGQRLVWPLFTLGDGRTWTAPIASAAAAQPTVATLYIDGQSAPYRRVTVMQRPPA